MRPWLDVRTAIGSTALLAVLALGGPGVRATRAADDAPVSAAPIEAAGPTCEAATPTDATGQVEALVEGLRARAATGPEAGEMPVVLNNRGYNYGPAQDDPAAALARQLDLIRRESAAR